MKSFKNFHFIGLGQAGSMILEHTFKKGLHGRYTCVSRPERFSNPMGLNLMEFQPPLDEHFKNTRYPEAWTDKSVPLIVPGKIMDIFNENEYYILVAGLGGYTGTKFSLRLSEFLSETGKHFSIIVTLPASFEGNKKNNMANDALNQLDNYNCHVAKYEITDRNKNIPFPEYYKNVDEEAYILLESLFRTYGTICNK